MFEDHDFDPLAKHHGAKAYLFLVNRIVRMVFSRTHVCNKIRDDILRLERLVTKSTTVCEDMTLPASLAEQLKRLEREFVDSSWMLKL